ncbi:hypothetical protein QBC34DRAFT_115795 [Podospora aff. communis PSN243]|uniref:Arrestin-like N-terminal domain-containing protein n=1 Tax=Podospora aff. communis PSN243 TaxID=3040156 RepID=A0AAV9GJ62_9PEZI|nr:hypothetical protein QBC34DRAFT_115795 [Podospora aff. communis PSN243]
MSIRIALDNPAEFYTNLDVVRGHVVISLSRNEHIGAVIVKLEGESKTALGMPPDGSTAGISHRELGPSGDILVENHKILYKVAQVFPDENKPQLPVPIILAPGTHRFPFQFRFPFNNACSDPEAMARIGGLAGPGGLGSGSGLFGLGGIRVMDGTKQLMYTHAKQTLPPSFTGFPGEAEIRYYIKVTIQRPGLFRENWRYQIGLKFLPIEPPRPAKTNQEAYARRPFTFRPKSRSPSPAPETKKRSNLFNWQGSKQQSNGSPAPSPTSPGSGATLDVQLPASPSAAPPSIEMSARLPHPAILTCNKPIPLRLLAKKTAPVDAEVFLIALQIDLIGQTTIRCQDLVHTEVTRWVIVSRQGLSVPVSRPGDAVGAEIIVPDVLWRDMPLPNTVMPSFMACNLSRDYQLEVKIGLAWGKAQPQGKGKARLSEIPQEIHLPLHFSSIEVFSGLAPSPELLEAMRRGKIQRRQTNRTQRPPPLIPQHHLQQVPPRPSSVSPQHPPQLPPRQNTYPTSQGPQSQRPHQAPDPLYPPQLRPGQVPGQSAPPYDDAPPSYDEAMAEMMTGPVVPSTARPAYSGVTNENEPSTLPEKN